MDNLIVPLLDLNIAAILNTLNIPIGYSTFLFVLAFKPTFAKYPLPESIDAALNGEVVIPCEPEGAPKPEITWLKNNVQVNSDSRVQIMPNNFLKITQINYGDQGFYECRAKNVLGTDGSFCKLNVKGNNF